MPALRKAAGFAVPILGLAASPVWAQEVDIPFDQSVSDVEVTLTVQGTSDTDTSPVTGRILIDIEDVTDPMQFVVLDLELEATEPIDHDLDFGFLGSFSQTTNDLRVADASPGVPSVSASVSGGMYTLPALDVILSGNGNFDATGTICSLLQNEGLPCSGNVDLSDGDPVTAENITGMLSIEGGVVMFTALIDVSVPLDPTDPSLGSVDVSGFASGAAPAPETPCPGDCDGSGDVNFSDLVAMLGRFGTPSDGAGCDVDGSGTVNFSDLVAILGLFGPCE